jgi:hypothetical protein
MLGQNLFAKHLALECRRAERTGRPFVMMLLDPAGLIRAGAKDRAIEGIVMSLASAIRETDIQGWYEESVIGVIFTELGTANRAEVSSALFRKASAALCQSLTIEHPDEASILLHMYPEDWQDGRPVGPAVRLQADASPTEPKRLPHLRKTAMNISGNPRGGLWKAGAEARRE